MSNELDALRGEIDRIDGEMVELFRRRMEVAGRIAAYKQAHGLPTLVPERERELLRRVAEQAGPELADYTESLFRTVMAASRSYQDARMGKHPRVCQQVRAATAARKRCGLIGRPLGHSFSPAIHARLGDYDYRLIELEPEEVAPFLRKGDFDGLNVTIPYKKAVLPLCDELTPQAARIGSVNTIVRRADGSLLGHNTDYDGFLWLLRRSGAAVAGRKVLVLGSGGASATVQTVLRDLGAGQVVVVSRTGADNYGNLSRHADARLLVNTTPVGMYPHTGVSPVALEELGELEAVLDVVYNPARTQLLLDAERRGIPCANGLGMLVAQAGAAAERFLDAPIPDGAVEDILRALERETENLLLIGMPGCGKSTVAAALAERLHRPLVDLDAVVAARAGCSIPALFAREGEEGFRRREHEALCEAGKESGLVIAAGGGIVTKPENRDPMRQNSRVIWLRRALGALPTEGRPLSQAAPLETLYRQREPLYRAWADRIVDNNGTVEDTVERILEGM